MQFPYALVTTLLLVLLSVPNTVVADTEVEKTVDLVFRQVASGEKNEKEAENVLAQLPRTEVVHVVVRMLKGELVSKRADLRELAYKALVHHRAADYPDARTQLIYCLGDPAHSIQQLCCSALDAPFLEKELDRLIAELDSANDSDTNRRNLVHRMGGMGSIALRGFDKLAEILANRTSDSGLRREAAKGMLLIGGLSKSIDHFESADDTSMREILWSLTEFIAESDKACGLQPSETYRLSRNRARQLTLKCLKSSDREVRAAALETIGFVYGVDWVIYHSSDRYEWNPEPRLALQGLVTVESDPELLRKAQGMLEFDLDKGAARLLRDLKRAGLTVDSDGVLRKISE